MCGGLVSRRGRGPGVSLPGNAGNRRHIAINGCACDVRGRLGSHGAKTLLELSGCISLYGRVGYDRRRKQEEQLSDMIGTSCSSTVGAVFTVGTDSECFVHLAALPLCASLQITVNLLAKL